MRRLLFAALFVVAAGCNTEALNTYNTPPQAQITLPAPDALIEDLPITFAGNVRDAQDSPEELTIRWYDNLTPDEALFEGTPDTSGNNQFVLNSLATGEHVITFEVTDTKGATDSDSVLITVATDPPLVEITDPTSGSDFYAGDWVHFAGVVSNADQDVFDLDVTWVSDIDGPMYEATADATGFTEFDESELSVGQHIISLYAYDEFGTQGFDSITINVSDIPPGELDQDGDGYCPDGIDANGDGVCDETEITGPNTQDCNDDPVYDRAPFIHPNAEEVCDGVPDNNCDGVWDETDVDVDGDGYSPCQGDCDDANPFVNPDAEEICDGLDNNCDAYIPPDEVDADGDGWHLCLDCDDNNDAVNPGVTEICDGFDNDCDGIEDNGFDLDGDGWSTCEGDCNDANNVIHPDAWDDCTDNIDSDCDGLVNDDMAGAFEMWETSPSSSGYDLSIASPQLLAGPGSCQFDAGFLGTFHLEPGSGAASGNFSATSDLYDIFEFDTGLTSNTAAWGIILTTGGVPAGCGAGQISWNSTVPIQVSMYIEGDLIATGIGSNETETFQLNLFQLFDVDYTIVVEPTASWIPDPTGVCGPSYTLEFDIP